MKSVLYDDRLRRVSDLVYIDGEVIKMKSIPSPEIIILTQIGRNITITGPSEKIDHSIMDLIQESDKLKQCVEEGFISVVYTDI